MKIWGKSVSRERELQAQRLWAVKSFLCLGTLKRLVWLGQSECREEGLVRIGKVGGGCYHETLWAKVRNKHKSLLWRIKGLKLKRQDAFTKGVGDSLDSDRSSLLGFKLVFPGKSDVSLTIIYMSKWEQPRVISILMQKALDNFWSKSASLIMFVYTDSKMNVVCIPEHVWIDFQRRCSEVKQQYTWF